MAVVQADVPDKGVNFIKALRYYWFIVIPIALLLRFLYYKFASPLRKYPGPFLASGSRLWKGQWHAAWSLEGLILISG